MNKKQSLPSVHGLLRIVMLAIILLQGISYGYVSESPTRRSFHSEAFFVKSTNSKKSAISYKKAIELQAFDSERKVSLYSIARIISQNTLAKIKFSQQNKNYCCFKPEAQFFTTITVSRNSGDEISIS